MPTTQELLAGLSRITNDLVGLAMAWHVVAAAVIVALLAGWRPSRRLACSLLALPALSVAEVAWAYGNPFNGSLFVLLAVAAVAFAPRDAGRVELGPAWAVIFGTALLAFAWMYPHFLDLPAAAYLAAAPLGLIPCPTLAALAGVTLVAGGFGGRGWSLVVAGFAAFYGVFGAIRLDVTLDVALLAGAAALTAFTLVQPGHRLLGPPTKLA